jgi:hypothetical protein
VLDVPVDRGLGVLAAVGDVVNAINFHGVISSKWCRNRVV